MADLGDLFKSYAIIVIRKGYMYEELQQKMREIIWRKWTAEGYPTVEENYPPVLTAEIYDELVDSGVSPPSGAMEQILKLWMSQGYIRASAVGGSSEDKQRHGSMRIVAVYESRSFQPPLLPA